MSRCVVIGGAPIEQYEAYKKKLSKDDYVIYCDGGLKHEKALGYAPSLIVGDFDSYEKPVRDEEMITLPREKDDTDTMYALKEGLKRGYREFLMIGVCGGRMDHTLVNVYALLFLRNHGAKGVILDDFSELLLVGEEPVFVSGEFPYFSLVNITGLAEGINIENAKYNLTDGVVTSEYQYATSNEVLPGKQAKIWVNKGELLLIRVRRDIEGA